MTREQASRDYQRIAEAIAWLRAHCREQPSLAQAAARCGLSEGHFQRLFSRWAGISPKRYLQYLTVEYAKQRMHQQPDLLSLSLDAGLSGPGRLHDLFVNLEGLSPGEFKRGAQGLTLGWAEAPTPFGKALLAFSARGLCHLSFSGPGDTGPKRLGALWPGADLVNLQQRGNELAERIFNPQRADRPLSAWVVGSNFQLQVWRALLSIPFADIRSYRQVAEQLGRPAAARSVGSAIAKNPLGYLVPCHRVLRGSGEAGEYHWGTERKAAMIAWEAAQLEARTRIT